MKIAKEALGENNNFVATVTSGSKGDYFNIAQIAGILGQQNHAGQRIAPTLTNGTRTLPFYPINEELSKLHLGRNITIIAKKKKTVKKTVKYYYLSLI